MTMTDKDKLDKIKALLPEMTNPCGSFQYCELVNSIKEILGVPQVPEDFGFYYHVMNEGTGGYMPQDPYKEGYYMRVTPISSLR